MEQEPNDESVGLYWQRKRRKVKPYNTERAEILQNENTLFTDSPKKKKRSFLWE